MRFCWGFLKDLFFTGCCWGDGKGRSRSLRDDKQKNSNGKGDGRLGEGGDSHPLREAAKDGAPELY